MTGELVLLVDDEENIVQLARIYLERDGYSVISAGDGKSGLSLIESKQPALVVLDIMLPEMDGFDVCRKLRSEGNNIPVIMLTARDEDIDKIVGLELGADDYLTKPFNPRELIARVKAVLRRVDAGADRGKGVIRLGDLTIDPARREVACQGELIELRTQEFEVLCVLARNKGLVLSREQLLNQAWGFDFFGQTRTVDVHVAQIRSKLSRCKAHIETVTGVGYKLVA